MRGNELFDLLGAIFDKLERIEKHLGIEEESTELDGRVKLNVVEDVTDNVVELHPTEKPVGGQDGNAADC